MSFLHLDIVGEMIKETWGDYSKNFLKLAVIVVLAQLIERTVHLVILKQGASMDSSLALALFGLTVLLADAFALCAGLRLLNLSHKNALERNWFKQACSMGLKTYFSALLVSFATILLWLVLVFLTILLVMAALAQTRILLTVVLCASCVTLCLAIWVSIRIFLAIPAAVLEGWGALRAIIRGFVISAGNFWILLLLFAIFFIPYGILTAIASNLKLGLLSDVYPILLLLAAKPFLYSLIYRSYLRLAGEE